MKKTIWSLILIIISLTSIYVTAKHFWRGEVMDTKQVCQRWGNEKFDISRFKKARKNKNEKKWPL